MSHTNKTIIKLEHVSHGFQQTAEGPTKSILEDISLQLPAGKIIALLGKSGSGKSTLLRIIAGLIEPQKGQVFYHGPDEANEIPNISMVFQTFALLPWLTVYENVALGIEAQGLPKKEIHQRTTHALNLIGLDGYESAYPKELSGGMRQRVGFARALVMNPEVLLMDEPFSALDVLTSENLRGDLLDLWIEKITPLKSILLVTHNIEEALLLADQIMLLSSNPGKIIAEITVDLPHPRDKQSEAFQSCLREIYHLMTAKLYPGAIPGKSKMSDLHSKEGEMESIPAVPPLAFSGFLDVLNSSSYNGSVEIATLASDLHLNYADTAPLLEALKLLHFITVQGTLVSITPSGRIFSEGNLKSQKKVLAEHLIKHVHLAGIVRRMLQDADDKQIQLEALEEVLQVKLPQCPDLSQTLKTIIAWGSYAGLFIHDRRTQLLHLRK